MSAKTSPARRAAFLKTLAETGNHTIAAARARVSRSWVTSHKTNDPSFRAACDAAVAQAIEAARAGGSATPMGQWKFVSGEEIVLRAAFGRRVVMARARLDQWTTRAEEAFLSTLAVTCNVTAASEAAGFSARSAYARRSKWPETASKWAAALEAGYDRLEEALLGNAVATLSGMPDLSPEAPMPPMNIADAIQLLRLHQHSVRGTGNRVGGRRKWKSLDDVRASVVRKLELIERAAAREAQRQAVSTELAVSARSD
ncbi:MAG: hypothetical protein V4530_11890 [Pseudomonadota bacterium]